MPQRVVNAFRYFDRNDSGFLDYRELRDALNHMGFDCSTGGAKEVVMRYDDRPDGKLDVNEFAELVRDIDRLLEKHIDAVHSKVQSLVRSDIDYAIANLRKETELVVADVHHRIQCFF